MPIQFKRNYPVDLRPTRHRNLDNLWRAAILKFVNPGLDHFRCLSEYAFDIQRTSAPGGIEDADDGSHAARRRGSGDFHGSVVIGDGCAKDQAVFFGVRPCPTAVSACGFQYPLGL